MKRSLYVLLILSLLMPIFSVPVAADGPYDGIERVTKNHCNFVIDREQSKPGVVAGAGNPNRQYKIWICHYLGNGEYVLLNVAISAISGHIDNPNHPEDIWPGDPRG